MNLKKIVTVISVIIIIVILYVALLKNTEKTEKEIINNTNSTFNELRIDCESDIDCRSYISFNTCETICANTKDMNEIIVENFRPSCDPAVWDPENIECGCINSICKEK